MAQKEHVGSDPKAAEKQVKKTDFGVHESDRTARNYVSQETRSQDKGGGTMRSGTGPRTSGVGGNDSGPGSSSGGDFDADNTRLTGVADPNQHPPHERQTAAKPGDRPMLDTPVVGSPTRGGVVDNESSTSSADIHNETADEPDDPAFEADITSDEAGGNSHK